MGKKQRTLRFELPFAVADPVLVHPEQGIARAVRGRGPGDPHRSTSRDVTLLDTTDHRLLRAGIVLAHRVSGELGEWYLDAPGWEPWLPTDRVEPLGAAGDLPDEFAALVRPFRRRAPLGPVAALHLDRTRWALLDAEEQPLARLSDERITIRRGGVTTGRHREVSLRCDGLDASQRELVVQSLLACGATQLDVFPSLAERIGPPATGLSDFRGAVDLGEQVSLEAFVGWLFSRRLDELLRADLDLRSGRDDDMDHLREQLAELRGEVRSLAFALEPQWREHLEQEIDLVLSGMATRTVHQLGDEYFDVLDSLVLAARAPKLGDQSHQQAMTALQEQMVQTAAILVERAGALGPASADVQWAATLASARQVGTLAHTGRVLLGKQARRAEKAVAQAVELLQAAQMPPGVEEPGIDLEWDAVTAFQEGRRFERRRAQCQVARENFLDSWPKTERRLRKLKEK
ncbi:hypothetical protein ACTQ49_05875 [Luteococcus sp. Sow4_B9]|uniref:hypothetical protein n=1 Tax=Luteococcus sp. Sow4_B9 TaxID=3438792 RepID=UPI003F9C409C